MDKELINQEIAAMRASIAGILDKLTALETEVNKPPVVVPPVVPPVVVPPVVPPVVLPVPPTVVRQPKGFYVMQAVGRQNVTDAKLNTNKHVGLVIRESWANLNPTKGQYNYKFLDAQIARCVKFKKKFFISIYTGSSAPSWIGGAKFGPAGKLAPLPWSPEMLAAYKDMITAVGKKYNSHVSLDAVEIGGPTCPDMSIEMHFTNKPQNQAGYSEAAMIDAWCKCGKAVAEAFPNVAVITDGGPAPGGNKATINNAFYDYMFKNFASQFNVSHCALSADVQESWLGHQLVVNHKKRGGRVGFEAVCGSVDRQSRPISRFGGSFAKSVDIGLRAGMSWYKYYQDDEQFLTTNVAWL